MIVKKPHLVWIIPSCLFLVVLLASDSALQFILRTPALRKSLSTSTSSTSRGSVTLIWNGTVNDDVSFAPPKNTTVVRFIFVVGLEGTGHHFLSSIMKVSPRTKLFNSLRLRKLQVNLERAFFYGTHGLMDANCHDSYPINTTEQSRKAIHAMHAIKTRVLKHQRQSGEQLKGLDILVNSNGLSKVMLSYPTAGRGACGRLKGPRLDLFYDVCAQADNGIDCGHVYLHRHPEDVVVSTTVKRPYNPSIHSALHLYTSFLHILYAHLTLYPDKTVACLGFYEPDMTEEWKVLRALGGWNKTENNNLSSSLEKDDFQQTVVEGIYAPPTLLSREDQQGLFPDHVYGPNLRAMWTAHQNLLELCRGQVQTNKMQTRRKA